MVRSFDFESKPNYEVPDLPDPPQIVGQSGQGAAPVPDPGMNSNLPHLLSAKRPKEHDLAALYTSGLKP